jgi:tetratricopeptide (TPR) repeat protein
VLRGRRFAEAESIAEALIGDDGLRVEGLLMSSRLAQAQGRLADARDALDRAFAERPDDLQMMCERCQFLFDNGATGKAEQTLRSLIAHSPDDASAHYNLGTLLMRTNRFDEAVGVYHQSLRYRPNYAATYLNLGYALRDSGRIDEAATAWSRSCGYRRTIRWRDRSCCDWGEHRPRLVAESAVVRVIQLEHQATYRNSRLFRLFSRHGVTVYSVTE